MEISPISGIRVMPVVKVRPAAPELTAEFDIEALVRAGDDAYSSAGRKAAGAEEPDEDLGDEDLGEDAAELDALEEDVVEFGALDDSDTADEPYNAWPAERHSGQISFFA